MSTLNLKEISIVHWCSDLEKHRCGYCKQEKCSISDGMWAEQLTVEDYQNLIDRGWRRSGKYCYKPIMDETCCPLYTIRCEVLNFHPSKSQKKIIKRFNRFITDGSKHKEENENDLTKSNDDGMNENGLSELISKQKPNLQVDFSQFKDNVIYQLNDNESESRTRTFLDCGVENDKNVNQERLVDDVHMVSDGGQCSKADSLPNRTEENITKGKHVRKGIGADPNKPPCKKAKLLRLERKQQKSLERKMSSESARTQNMPKCLEELIDEIPEDAKLKLKIQMEKIFKSHPHFKVEAKLFEKYQMAIHNDKLEECDEKQFCEFLVDTPLLTARKRTQDGAVTFGSYHQQYWIDDKLIAVGVLDILPRCVSSVYFFYDPDYRFLTLGTYGSLREINFVRSLHQKIPSIEYYYMGYYIHSCPKMRYKGRLSKSFLLCPETYKWFPIENCIPKLEVTKYSRLNDDIDAIDEEMCSLADVDRIKIFLGHSFTIYGNYKRNFEQNEIYQSIGKLIGKKCVDKLLFIADIN